MARQRVQFVADQPGGRLQRRNMRVGEPHVPARAREDRGPGASDQAGADDGDVAFSIWHFFFPPLPYSHSTLRRRSRSSRKAFDGPW